MQYVGLGIERSLFINIDQFMVKCLENGLILENDHHFDLDEEVQIGLKTFCNYFRIDSFRFRDRSNKGNKFNGSSDSISLDIANIHLIAGHNSKFLSFLSSNRHLLPKNFFLIFADIWAMEELDFKIRYLKADFNDINKYFNKNIGWEMILYDFKLGCPAFHYNVPLIFEVTNL